MNVHDIGIVWHHCGVDGCTYKAEQRRRTLLCTNYKRIAMGEKMFVAELLHRKKES